MSSNIPYGNVNKLYLVTIKWSPFISESEVQSQQTVEVPGVIAASDFIISVTKKSNQEGLLITPLGSYANGQVTINIESSTDSDISTEDDELTFLIARRDNGPIGAIS